MRTLTWIIHSSLDGFAALKDGRLDAFPSGEENLQFVCDLCKNADTAVMGRKSWELLNAHWPQAGKKPEATPGELIYSNWYNQAEKIVVSTTVSPDQFPDQKIIADDVLEQLKIEKEKEGGTMILFGSPMLAESLLRSGLIDEIWFCINPVSFGEGIPVFGKHAQLLHWELKAKKQFPNGELALCYRAKPAE